MIKVGTLYREKIIDLVKNKSEGTGGLFFINFDKLTSIQLNALRKNLRANSAQMLVAKNRLIKRSWESLDLSEVLKGQTGVVYAHGDIVETAKALYDFRKENEFLGIKGGVVDETMLSGKEVEALSKLPGRQQLLGMVVNCVASPITGLVCSLNQIITKFAYAINAIKDKKEKGGE